MTSIILHSRRSICQQNVRYALGLRVSADFFFRNLRSSKARFHIAPFRPTRYVLKSFRYLEVRNRVRNLNKFQNIIFVGRTSIMPIGITNIHIEINVSVFINKRSFISVLWLLSCSELKWRQNYYFSTIIISNSQIETLDSYSSSLYVNVNICFLIVILKETLVHMCLASHFHIIESWKVNVGHRVIYYFK